MIKTSQQQYVFGDFRLVPSEQQLLKNGTALYLEPKTFDILRLLIVHADTLVTKDEILENVWPGEFVNAEGINVRISDIRKALGSSAKDCAFIETIPKKGYRFFHPVEILSIYETEHSSGSNDHVPPETVEPYDEEKQTSEAEDNNLLNSKLNGNSAEQLQTVFHLFCPTVFQHHATIFWLVLVFGWYSFSFLVEFNYSDSRYARAIFPMALCCITVIVVSRFLRVQAELLRRPLQSQTKESQNRFDNWFDEQICSIFGRFVRKDNSISFIESLKSEKVVYIIKLLWLVVMLPSAIYFSESFREPIPILIKRICDYMIVVAIMYAAARYSYFVTNFVYQFSRLHLKPLLNRLRPDGIRVLGPFLTYNIGIAICVFCLLHWSFAISYTSPDTSDLYFLILGTSVVTIWTVFLPFQLLRAMKAAKNRLLNEFSGPMQVAFDNFVASKTDETRQEFDRTRLNQENIIRQVPVWPLTWWETLGAIGGGNLLLLLSALGYIAIRLNII